MRQLIVVVLTIAIVTALGYGLKALSRTIDFWPFMGVCAAGVGICLVYGWHVDRSDAKRAAEEGIVTYHRVNTEPMFGRNAWKFGFWLLAFVILLMMIYRWNNP